MKTFKVKLILLGGISKTVTIKASSKVEAKALVLEKTGGGLFKSVELVK